MGGEGWSNWEVRKVWGIWDPVWGGKGTHSSKEGTGEGVRRDGTF